MSGLFSIGVSGMSAAQLGLLTTEHNITNANTAGYNRQRISQATNIANSSGSGFIGQGTYVQTISRIQNSYLQAQVNSSQSKASELSAYADQIKQIDNMLADASAGLSPALQDMFSAVQQVAANPSSIPARQAYISSVQSLVTRFQTMESRMKSMYDGTNQKLSTTVDYINSYAEQVAELNHQIVIAQASTGQPPNDLLDRRDQLIADLNKEVRTNTVLESDGSVSVFIGNGQQLVVGQRANKLGVAPSLADNERYVVSISAGPGMQELPESLITGGNLGGLLRFRSETLDKSANALGNLAVSLAAVFNSQQSLGQDLLGQTSGTAGFADKIFLLDSTNAPKIITHTRNTGAGVLTKTPATAPGQFDGFLSPSSSGGNFNTSLTNSDYELTFGAGGAYTVRRLSDNVQVLNNPAGVSPAVFDGVSIDISTAGNPGDKFTIEPTREVARNLRVNPLLLSDARLVAAATPVRSAGGLNNITNLPNSGNGAISGPTVSPGYSLAGVPMTLSYNAVTNEFSGFPGIPYDPIGTTFTTATGVSFTITGMPADGDSFVIEANTNGFSDASNAVLMGMLQTQSTMFGATTGGKTSLQGAYARLVSEVGNKAREVQVTSAAQTSLVEQAQSARDSLSGVNLDEEASNLLRFQYAYQASAKMLDVGSRLFDAVLSLGH